jgi:hypothetical protein
VVVGDHVRKELLREVVVRECVDLEGEVDVFLGAFEDGLAAYNTGIVDQDSGVAERRADLTCSGGDGFGRREIAVEVADGGGC